MHKRWSPTTGRGVREGRATDPTTNANRADAGGASPRLRDAQPPDAPLVVEMIRMMAALEGDASPLTPDYVADYLSHENLHALLAEIDGRVVGLLTYSFHPGLFHAGTYAMIDELIVRPESQGAGVGDALMTEVMRRIAAAGCSEASVSTGLTNARAQALYRKHGLVDEALLLEKHFD